MLARLTKVLGGLIGVALIVSALGGLTAPASADTSLQVPWYTGLLEQAGSYRWTQQPGSLTSERLSVIVHLDIPPLAVVGRHWSHQQRVAHVARIRAAQDALVPQIESLGGVVRGRFTHLSAGLAVEIDADKAHEVRQWGGVVAVRAVNTYELDLSETVPWIGAAAVQELGYTGEGVDVAVIDSGVDYTHAKLGGAGTLDAYAEAYCGDPAATPDPFDPACIARDLPPPAGATFGPGHKVVGGYDWVGELWPQPDPRCGVDGEGDPLACIVPDPNPIDFEGHGTHVADIIGGLESSAGAGDMGVAPGVNIWAFKACSAVSSSCNGLALLLAIDDAMDLDDSDYGACDPSTDVDCLTYDPADVVNMSLGALYGQPEDDLTLFTDIASYYGSLMVVSAGNSADKPYIVGSPSSASGALSVAETTVPSSKLYTITAGDVTVGGILQAWGPELTPISGTLTYDTTSNATRQACTDASGASPWVGTPLAGQVVLIDRGTCAISRKADNAAAAGAVLAIIANNQPSNTPPSFAYGGGEVTIPALTITLNDGNALKTVLGTMATASPDQFVALEDDLLASSSRGPRIADGAIKPDIAAPGASVSAVAGTGTGQAPFGGTSGAAPMVAGTAALLIEALEDRGVLDSDPGLDGPYFSFTPALKSLLMNTANPDTYIGGSLENGGSGFLSPITLQGAGRVDALAALATSTIAWDITELYAWAATGTDAPCEVSPVLDVTNFLFFGIPPECAEAFPFGNDFFNAWNAQTGSLSFGYDGVAGQSSETRQVALLNLSDTERTYDLNSSFRYDDDQGRGVSLEVVPAQVTLPPLGLELIEVTLTADARDLRDWTLDAGQFGRSGTNIFCNDPNPQYGCPTLTMFEYDGFVTIDGGDYNLARLPWQVLPKKAAQTYVARATSRSVRLRNPAHYKPGDTDVFALVDISPNNCEIVAGGACVEEDYVPGILPGINATAIDLHEIGVRSYIVPGLYDAYGLPEAPFGAPDDEVIEFGITVYDAPYRASHNYPVEFDIYVDADRDGVDDYIVFNADQAFFDDGRNAVFVLDINPSDDALDGTPALQPYFFSATNFNSQNWILPVPAAAIGVAGNRPFDFFVIAFDNYFTGDLWDCSPFNGGACGGAYHTFQTGLPKYRPVTNSLQVPARGSYTLPYSTSTWQAAASPSQIGLLFMYRDAEVGRESDSVILDP